MSTNSVRIFRFEIEGNKFRIDAQSADSNSLQTGVAVDPLATDSVQLLLAKEAANSNNTSNQTGYSDYTDNILPKNIVFVASQTVVDERATAMMNYVSQTGNTANTMPAGASTDARSGWSDPIFFYPDGTTSTARLILRNKEGMTIELLLRGLTGVVKVGQITASDAKEVL